MDKDLKDYFNYDIDIDDIYDDSIYDDDIEIGVIK